MRAPFHTQKNSSAYLLPFLSIKQSNIHTLNQPLHTHPPLSKATQTITCRAFLPLSPSLSNRQPLPFIYLSPIKMCVVNFERCPACEQPTGTRLYYKCDRYQSGECEGVVSTREPAQRSRFLSFACRNDDCIFSMEYAALADEKIRTWGDLDAMNTPTTPQGTASAATEGRKWKGKGKATGKNTSCKPLYLAFY